MPIILKNGELFGTLCAVDSQPTQFSEETVQVFERVAKLFSYFLELERNANYDQLTGLYNRNYLYSFFRDNVENIGTMMFLDLDGFKAVNDQFGHDVGDFVIKEVADRIKQAVRGCGGFAARLGGDEFVINFVGLSDRDVILKKADQLLSLLSNWTCFEYKVKLSTSIGIIEYAQNAEINKVLKGADNALYRAKAKGKNQYDIEIA